MPLTPPRTPLEPIRDTHLSGSNGEHIIAPGTASHANTCGENTPTPDAVSLITVQYDQLPYSQSISPTTPSIHILLDEISLTLEFVQVFSGHLSVAQAECTASLNKGYHVVDIRDIPTAEELQLNCSNISNEHTIQLQNDRKGIVRFTFVWDDQLQRNGGLSEISRDTQVF